MKKNRCSISKKTLIGTLIVVTTMAMALPQNSWAMLAPAQTANELHQTGSLRADDLKTIQTALESKIIRQRLTGFNLTPEQIDSRLAKLSDAQLHQTAQQIRTVNPGGDAGGFLISVLVIVILVGLIMYIFKRI